MPLNDLIKNYSINTISQKTNISIEVLDKLINRDWENLQRAKVNGFLNIIERDFEIELNELREEANSYYQEHKVASSNRPIDLVDSQSVGGGGSKILGNILTIATLGLISYATWFYFIKPTNSVNSDDKNSSGLIKDSIKSAKELVGEVNKSENNENNISKNRDLTQLKDSKSSNNTIDRVVTIVERNTTEVKQLEEGNSSKKFDITANLGAESNISTNNINSNEVNLSVDSNRSIKDRVEKIIDESNSSSDLNSSVTANNDTNTELNNSENINEINGTQDSEVKAEDSLNAIESAKIVLKSKKLWLGEYNIDTNRKNSIFLKGSYSLDINSGKIVLTSGHCQYSIVTNKKTINLSKLKKCYVLVSKEDGVKIITKNEYKTLTKRRAW